MKLGITTPALVFSTVSLLMVAYTTRFLGLATLIRNLHNEKGMSELGAAKIHMQIVLLKKRVHVIKYMQFFGVLSLVSSIFSIVSLYIDNTFLGEGFFIVALILLLASLILSLIEIKQSTDALTIALDECDGENCPI